MFKNFALLFPICKFCYLQQTHHDIEKINIATGTTTDVWEIAEHLNRYFQSIFLRRKQHELECSNCAESQNITITCEGVLAMLLKLDDSKSPGPDDIHNASLKRYAEKISAFLTDLFQLSLASGEMPAEWGKARLVPVNKKGEPLNAANYRPIWITGTCCEMLEHVIAPYIQQHLEDNRVL